MKFTLSALVSAVLLAAPLVSAQAFGYATLGTGTTGGAGGTTTCALYILNV